MRLDACTLACDEGFQNGRDGHSRLVCVCPSNEVYDPDKTTCVPRENCGGVVSSLDGDLRWCVSEETCAQNDGYIRQGYDARICEGGCYASTLFETSQSGVRTCVDSCGERFVTDAPGGHQCVDTCKNETFQYTEINGV